jgi:ARG/rhodanese/phosphatase superfamily protein
METRPFILWSSVIALVAALAVPASAAEPAKAPPLKPACRLSGPYTRDNLTIYLVHGDDQLKGKDLLTLEEALEQKKVIVHETKNVNELSIENVSDREVFIQAGDLVKGGQQDRTIANDMILAAKSGKVPLNSFCVESGRWQQRGGEDAAKFGSAKEQIANKDLKIAARRAMRQKEVWQEVEKAQTKLSKNLNTDVKAAQSATSYQLTLEHKKLREAVDAHVKKLSGTIEGKDDVIGYVFAVNGKLNSADVYASHALFVKLWPKLLRSTAVEAVSELQKDKKFESVTAEQVQAFLADADAAKANERDINGRTKTVTQETHKTIRFDTRDRANEKIMLRRNVLAH